MKITWKYALAVWVVALAAIVAIRPLLTSHAPETFEEFTARLEERGFRVLGAGTGDGKVMVLRASDERTLLDVETSIYWMKNAVVVTSEGYAGMGDAPYQEFGQWKLLGDQVFAKEILSKCR